MATVQTWSGRAPYCSVGLMLALLLAFGTVSRPAASQVRSELAERQLPPLTVGGALIDTRLVVGGFLLTDEELRGWVARSAQVAAEYFGRFPVPELDVHIHTSGGRGTRTGNMRGWGERPLVNEIGRAHV